MATKIFSVHFQNYKYLKNFLDKENKKLKLMESKSKYDPQLEINKLYKNNFNIQSCTKWK